jgi:hypothetical protein
MAVYNLSPIVEPQYVAATSAALALAPPGAGSAVPAGYYYQIAVCRVSNVTNAPVSLQVWRVPSGASADNAHMVLPPINVPVASQTFPDFDLTTLWGIVLRPGDAIFAIAGAASSLVIHADGAVIQI